MDATWKSELEFGQCFLEFHLEDKVALEGRASVVSMKTVRVTNGKGEANDR